MANFLFTEGLLDKMCAVVEELIDKNDLRSLWRKFRFDADDIYALELDYKGKAMLKPRVAASMALWLVSSHDHHYDNLD